jgi:hypothetical protein
MAAASAHADTPPADSARAAQAGECDFPPCRPARQIDVPAENHSTLRYSIKPMGYLTQDHHITIEPGERLVFRFPDAGEQPGDPQFVRAEIAPAASVPDMSDKTYDKLDKSDAGTFALAAQTEAIKANGTAAQRLKEEPPGTLILTYRAIPGAVGMMLDIEHNLPKPIKFDAFMARPKSDGWKLEYTTTCPVRPGIQSGENWPEPLGMIILEKFRFLADSAPVTCE